MKSKGNGTPEQCVANLLNLYQNEVPYARLKGMPPDIIDKPKDEAAAYAKRSAAWLIKTYEPRVTLNNITTTETDEGRLIVVPDITVNER